MRAPRHAEDARLHALGWRIGLRAATLVIGCILVTAAALVTVYLHQTNVETDALLAASATRITEPATAPLGTYLAIEAGGALRTTPGMPQGLPDLGVMADVRANGGSRQRVVDLDPSGAYYVIRTTRVDDRVVQVVLDQTQVEEGRERLFRALLVAGLIGLVLAAGSAVLLARRAVRPLATTIRMQRRFVADASHELRTPVTLLSTRAQLLARKVRRDGLAADVVRDADGLVTDAAALTEILEDLLLTTELSDDRHREVVDVGLLVGSVVEASSPHALALGIRLEVDPVETTTSPATVTGHPVALRRAVTAVVDNALEHGRSAVVVSMRLNDREVVVDVTDDGPGIPADQVLGVFERFHSGARSGGGTAGSGRRHYGLGLALVAEVAAVHGGSAKVEQRPDGQPGTVLRLRLPRRPLI